MKIKILFMVVFLGLGVSSALAQQAVVIKLEGSVEVKVDASSPWQAAQEGQFLQTQSQVKTGPTGKVIIAFGQDHSNIITIEKNTETVIEQIKPGAVYLPKGRVFTIIRDLSQIENFEIKTPTAIAGARGTGWVTEVADGKTEISVFEDIVAVRGFDENGAEVSQLEIHQDLTTSISSDGHYEEPAPISEETKEELYKTSQEIIQHVQEFDPSLIGKPGPQTPGSAPSMPPIPPMTSMQPLPPKDANQPRDPAHPAGEYSTQGMMLPPPGGSHSTEGQPPPPPDGNFNAYMDQFNASSGGHYPQTGYDYSGDHYFGEFDQQWDGEGGTFVQYDPYQDPQQYLQENIYNGSTQPICPCYAQCYQPGVQCSPSCYQLSTVCQPPPNPPGCFCGSSCSQACSPLPPPP